MKQKNRGLLGPGVCLSSRRNRSEASGVPVPVIPAIEIDARHVCSLMYVVDEVGFEPTKPEAPDLQSGGLDRFHYSSRKTWLDVLTDYPAGIVPAPKGAGQYRCGRVALVIMGGVSPWFRKVELTNRHHSILELRLSTPFLTFLATACHAPDHTQPKGLEKPPKAC